jgi:hypothetical protein
VDKNLKGHMWFKRLKDRFTLDAKVIYFCAAAYEKYALSNVEKTVGTRAKDLTDGF